MESALAKSQKVIAGFKEKYPSGTIAQKQYKAIILFEFNKLRGEFSQMDYPQYYQLMTCKEKVRNYFINHTFLDADIGNHCCQLRKTIVLNEKIKFFKHELYLIDERLINPSMDIEEMKNHFADIISVMIPNAEISEQLWRAFNQTLLAVVGRKPRYFIERDFKDTVRHIFKQALSDLKQSLDRLPVHIIEAYVANQLDELELLALTSYEFSKDLLEYINELKRLLEIKLKRHPLQQINPLANTETPFHDLQMQVIKKPVINEPDNKKISYGYKKSPGLLTPFIQLLDDRMNFLDPRTTVEDCVRIITSDNLNLIQEKIYLACKTNEFRYVINHLKAFFKSFNPATIGKSGIFISNTGHTISATNLNSAEMENVKTRYVIDNIFNKKINKNFL